MREAKSVRRTADRLERIAKSIAERRLAGKPIDGLRLCDAVNEGVAPYAIRRLAGVESGSSRHAVIDAVFGPPKLLPPHLAHLDLLAKDAKPHAAEIVDAFAQAVTIARNAAAAFGKLGVGVDDRDGDEATD